MSRDPRKIAASLTEAQRHALQTASAWSDGSGFFVRIAVRMDVRARLRDRGLLSQRPGGGLTKLGEQVRETLLEPK
jgi:hypothetical protein